MSEFASRAITSNQTGIHADIPALVAKYWQHEFLKPVAEHSQAAFAQVAERLASFAGPLILDSCCGVGESTAELAQRYPEALVVGIDKSAHRLGKHVFHKKASAHCGEYMLVRADLNDFWRLAAAANWQPEHHFLLYPNPWPKKKHLVRRWHGAPVFPAFVQLGGTIELRSNWSIYVGEFALALACVGITAEVRQLPEQVEPITPFERKYQASGQPLWQLTANLAGANLVAPENIEYLVQHADELAESGEGVLKSSARNFALGDARGA